MKSFNWTERYTEIRKPANIGQGAATGKVKGFCRVCGSYLDLPLKETVGFCEQCQCLRRCVNPFRERI